MTVVTNHPTAFRKCQKKMKKHLGNTCGLASSCGAGLWNPGPKTQQNLVLPLIEKCCIINSSTPVNMTCREREGIGRRERGTTRVGLLTISTNGPGAD